VAGEKTTGERFAGATQTFSIEAMMHDGKALQMGTSHNLGQNFAKVFQTQYLDEKNKQQYVWQTSWGVSTRMIGGLVMAHGDLKGLVLPPAVAPIQAVIVPIKTDPQVDAAAKKLNQDLKKQGIRVKLDDRDSVSAGFKFNDWELKGVPVRIELGPKDLAEKKCVLVRRDTGEKHNFLLTGAVKEVKAMLADMQTTLLAKRRTELTERTVAVHNYDNLKVAVANGFAAGAWCGAANDEAKLKEEAKATIRAIPFDQPEKIGACVICGQAGRHQVVFGRAY